MMHSTMAPVHIDWVDLDQIYHPRCLEDLTTDEQARASSFHFQKDRQRWAACRAWLRQSLGKILNLPANQVPLTYGAFGKPLLAAPFHGWHFNLSHSGKMAIIAQTPGGPLGIDLEPTSRAMALLECEATVCHPNEIAALPIVESSRALALLETWVRKEAYFKAVGCGLHHEPCKIDISPYASILKKSTHPYVTRFGSEIHRLINPTYPDIRSFLATRFPVSEIISGRISQIN